MKNRAEQIVAGTLFILFSPIIVLAFLLIAAVTIIMFSISGIFSRHRIAV
jgi:hypothetical protein